MRCHMTIRLSLWQRGSRRAQWRVSKRSRFPRGSSHSVQPCQSAHSLFAHDEIVGIWGQVRTPEIYVACRILYLIRRGGIDQFQHPVAGYRGPIRTASLAPRLSTAQLASQAAAPGRQPHRQHGCAQGCLRSRRFGDWIIPYWQYDRDHIGDDRRPGECDGGEWGPAYHRAVGLFGRRRRLDAKDQVQRNVIH